MVNSEEEPDRISKANIEGFPTIHLHHNGEVKKFNGERKHESFAKLWDYNILLSLIYSIPPHILIF